MNIEEYEKKVRHAEVFQEYAKLKRQSKKYRWKESAIYYKLFEKYGVHMFEFKEEIKIPDWFCEKMI